MLCLYPPAVGCDTWCHWFPQGLLGAIKTPYGYNMTDPGNETFPTSSDNSGKLDTQVGLSSLGISQSSCFPISPVPQSRQLTRSLECFLLFADDH